MDISRRHFFERSVFAAASATLLSDAQRLAQAATPVASPVSSTLRAAILGCGIRGKQHVREIVRMPDVAITHICDPDLDRVDELAALVTELGRPEPAKVQDLRRVFDDPTVDVVFIATPNHWHALAAIWAMQAGKDAYVEKPVSHNIVEGRRMVDAARKLGRICQTGTQNRSRGGLAEAVRYMHEGKLGEVRLARSVIYGGRGSIGGPVECPVPPRCDHNLWAGPASLEVPKRAKYHYDWHWMWDTGGGEIGNNNVHSIDICRWGLGVSGLGKSAVSYGGRLGYTDVGDTPNTQVGVFDFGNKTLVTETRGLKSEPFHPKIKSMWFFYGTNGIIADSHLFDLEGNLVRAFDGPSENHFQNFIKAVRSRKHEDLKAPILEGHQSTALCHIANISYRLGSKASPEQLKAAATLMPAASGAAEMLERTLQHLAAAKIDIGATPLTLGRALTIKGDSEQFLDNPEADALLGRQYRAPFTLPPASTFA